MDRQIRVGNVIVTNYWGETSRDLVFRHPTLDPGIPRITLD